jgi:bacilliredoxin
MYPEMMVAPMREELTGIGIKETRTSAAVEQALAQPGITMVVVNSICGCAAGKMRPAVRAALQHSDIKPDQSITVFAGQDAGATEKARSYFTGWQPSSPSIGLLRDGKLVYFMPRSDIETSDARTIATRLVTAFEQHCPKAAAQ